MIGSGDRIGLFVLPFLVVAIFLQVTWPSTFGVGGPSGWLGAVSIVVLAVGLVGWGWSVALILLHVPRHELITTGPFAVVKHPLYTSVSLLVLPWLGFLLDTWLGMVVGLALYLGARRYAPHEEADLAATFGPAWDRYERSVLLPQV